MYGLYIHTCFVNDMVALLESAPHQTTDDFLDLPPIQKEKENQINKWEHHLPGGDTYLHPKAVFRQALVQPSARQ